MQKLTMAAIALAAGCCLANPASADTGRVPDLRLNASSILRDVITPAEWGGIWDFEDEVYDCETHDLLSTEAHTDTICAGSAIEFGDPEIPFTCTGTANGNTVHVECSGSFEVIPDCVVEFTSIFDATRIGDTMEAIQTVSITYTGSGEGCDFLPDHCERTESMATRVGPEPVPCNLTPVETVDWGTMKSLYR